MKTNKLLKSLLSEAYEVEEELLSMIEQCFKEIFKDDAIHAFHLFEEDLEDGREWNGCIQNLEYFQTEIKQANERVLQVKKKHEEDQNAK